MRIISVNQFLELAPIIQEGDRMIDRALSVWDGKTDDWDLWRPVYDYIFSDAVQGKISEILGPIDYYDPDTTYQEDVCAYWQAVMGELRTTKVG